MLNELKMLADSIYEAGFPVKDWDNNFKEIKTTTPCFVIALSEEGEISDIRPLDRDKAAVLRTWQGGSNGETFPSFNFIPFYKLERKLKPAEQKEAFVKLIEAVQVSESPPESVGPVKLQNRDKADARTSKCLGEIARNFFAAMTKDIGQDDPFTRLQNALAKFVSRDVAVTFNRKIFAFLRTHLSNDEKQILSALWPILYAQKSDVVLFFDLVDSGDFPIASEKGVRTVNERLLKGKGDNKVPPNVADSEEDAFGKILLPNDFSKLPEVKLPHIGSVILRCMSKEAPCQMRYRHIDVNSFPISESMRKYVKAALVWMSSPDREGKTWAVAGKRELVFAYPRKMPPVPPLLARLLGADSQEARFEDYAETALKGLKTVSETASPNTEIEVFAIKKADASSKRAKVVFYRNYTLAKLEVAVSSWLAGADNIPPILLRKWPTKDKGEKAAKGTKPVFCEFRAPLPIAATGLVYTMWSQDGNEKFEPKFRSSFLYEDFPVFDGLELFLGESVVTGLTERMLSLLMQGMGTLCVAAGNLTRKRDVLTNARAVAYLETALPLFGILLHKLNRTKETYMENVPYLIGKFLNLADGLHVVWCRNVRDGQLPPQLLGSSLFASFQLNPVQGFANVGMRMKPYIDWAKTNQTGDIALSRWFVGEFGRVTAAIEKAGIPTRLSDADKAEMLLGYLSSSGKSVEPDSSDISTSDVHPTL